MFPQGSEIRRINREGVLLAGGGRALLMQLAHPLVARGVAEHSTFEQDPLPRLWRTLAATYTIVFGTRAEAEAVAAHLWRTHEGVVGAGYRANDPELLFWVHATLVDTALLVYRHFVRPLTEAESEAYYQDAMAVAELLGVPRAAQPRSYRAFRAYVRGRVETLAVSAEGKRLAASVLNPPLPFPAWPATATGRWLTAGLLPARLRREYGLHWTRGDQSALLAMARASRAVHALVPAAVRGFPAAFFAGRARGAQAVPRAPM